MPMRNGRAAWKEETRLLRGLYEKQTASAVAASTGRSGSAGNFAARVVQNTPVASHVELKGWEAWWGVHGTGTTLSEAKQLISDTKTRIKPDDMKKFDWELSLCLT